MTYHYILTVQLPDRGGVRIVTRCGIVDANKGSTRRDILDYLREEVIQINGLERRNPERP